jgi:hypothetical protein
MNQIFLRKKLKIKWLYFETHGKLCYNFFIEKEKELCLKLPVTFWLNNVLHIIDFDRKCMLDENNQSMDH